jgi:two-component system LytT family sensor kinase
VQQWQLTEQRAVSAEAEKASAELSFLKAQINPHFLFNTLNNIYTLAITNNANTAESIMKLSNIMRYVTDDVTANFVSLQSEVDCVVDYIDLQRLRLGSKTTVNFNITGTIAQQQIAPLLFMTFVENVFKYGVSKQYESAIDINLHVADDMITFMCVNPIFERKEHIERTGIGIVNTKQRLKHLYPGKHMLNITDDNDLFTVVLTLYT